ncbi:MAG: cell division topological specificity factor MinE [Clostridia bacterium]|nr:cell division topological specificity factor MinE [Clostridia bacterium]
MEIKEVFEPIVSFVKNFQKKEKDISKQAAKDRLKLVLMQDRASVSPDFFEMMKKEIIDVIKKYIEIDEESLEVQLTRGYEAGLEGPALYANIPIKNIKPVASNGEELSEDEMKNITDAVADEILDEASKRIEEGSTFVKAEIESTIEEETSLDELEDNNIVSSIEEEKKEIEAEKEIVEEKKEEEKEEEPKTADVIAENVAKEMKKSAAKAAAAAKASSSKKTVKKASTTKTTAKKVSKKKEED